MAKPTDERLRLEPDDLRWAARTCADALAPALDRDWRVRAGDLEWDAYTTLDHVVGALGYYAVNLAMRATVEVPFVTRSLTDELISADPRVPPTRLVEALEAMAAVLADVVRAAPSGARGYHPDGLADVEGFIAMGCDEILVHGDDVARGLSLTWQPPEELCRRILARLFPWAPVGEDPWSTLRWPDTHDWDPTGPGRPRRCPNGTARSARL